MAPLDRAISSHAGRSFEPDESSLYRFLRNSHIFSSAVREILETKFLVDTCDDPITLPQFHLLKLIVLNGQHHVGEIADLLGVSSPAASKNVDKLERLGLVRRTPSRIDRRVTFLIATEKARDVVNRYEAHKLERLIPLFDKFETAEIAQMSRLLERFSVLLYAREIEADGGCLRCAVYGQSNCPIGWVLGNCPYDKARSRAALHNEEEPA